ncbi:MAG: hypothetical protein HS117_18140 [Verrucomicrobiaceae bacterium]|nr:hypothetical protein [Verrucomicrobiaceae bacterium]
MAREIITIKKVKHPRYKFRVTFRQGESYLQKYFTAKSGPDGADAFMAEKRVELLNEGRKHADFTDDERKAVIRCRELAEGFAAAGVKGFTLDAALTFYADHLHLRRRSVNVLAAYDEFVETRRKEGVSAVHLRDFTYRLERFAKKHAKRLVGRDHDKGHRCLDFRPQERPAVQGQAPPPASQLLWLLRRPWLHR